MQNRRSDELFLSFFQWDWESAKGCPYSVIAYPNPNHNNTCGIMQRIVEFLFVWKFKIPQHPEVNGWIWCGSSTIPSSCFFHSQSLMISTISFLHSISPIFQPQMLYNNMDNIFFIVERRINKRQFIFQPYFHSPSREICYYFIVHIKRFNVNSSEKQWLLQEILI